MKRMLGQGVFLMVLIAASPVWAQFETGFEAPTYFADSDGEDLNGQDSFFNPNPSQSVSFKVHLYADNPLGISPPPTGGGDQFALGIGPGSGFFCRSQRPVVYGDGTGEWKIEFDVLVTYTGTLPSAQNVGSFSTQDFPADRTCIMLTTWTDPNTAETWDADMVWFNADGSQLQEKGPDGFKNLAKNRWYHRWIICNLDTNRITEIGIKDLTTNISSVANPTDRYLVGGSNPTAPPPDGFRLFAGTTPITGNTMAFDNVKIARPVPPPLCATNGCGEFVKMICKPDRGKVVMKGTGTVGLEIEVTYDGNGECATVNDRGKWKVVKKGQSAGEHTASACGTDKSCTL